MMSQNNVLDFTAVKPIVTIPLSRLGSAALPTSAAGQKSRDEFVRLEGNKLTPSQGTPGAASIGTPSSSALKPTSREDVSSSDQEQSRLTWADVALAGAVAIGVIGCVLAAALISPWIALVLVLSLLPTGAVLLSPRATRDGYPKPE